MSTFKCAIVTPSEQILDEEVVEVEFPQWDGQRGVLHGAAPFVAKLGTGRLRIKFADGADRVYLLNGGFAELHDDRLVLVADEIVPKEELELAEARERLGRAIEAVSAGGNTDLEVRARLEQERAVATAAVALAEGG